MNRRVRVKVKNNLSIFYIFLILFNLFNTFEEAQYIKRKNKRKKIKKKFFSVKAQTFFALSLFTFTYLFFTKSKISLKLIYL